MVFWFGYVCESLLKGFCVFCFWMICYVVFDLDLLSFWLTGADKCSGFAFLVVPTLANCDRLATSFVGVCRCCFLIAQHLPLLFISENCFHA